MKKTANRLASAEFKIRIASFLLFFLLTSLVQSELADKPSITYLPSRAVDQAGFTFHPSPTDWRNNTIYQIITDRFYDGDHANNTANPGGVYNPLSMDSIHGGDFAGITMHLDYIQQLGFNTIWISPVFLNHRGAYHGYHITDFNRIDPHWGTLEELRNLVDQAHQRNMYVIIDVVFNHMARMLTSDSPDFPRFSEHTYPMRWSNHDEQFAPPFNNLELFHGHGSIKDWESKKQNEMGDLQGLADLKTEREDVRQWLLESHKALIAATDCDGFRIDTAHHVELDFWQFMLPELRSYAATLGKTNFLMFAEALRGRDEDVSLLTREGEYQSALYYPYYFTLQDIWVSRHPTRKITERWNNLSMYGDIARHQLVAFGDNHDRARLLNESNLNGDTNRLKALLTMLYASPAIPCIYYGTEQGFSGSKGHRAREPMFNPLEPGIPDYFDPNSELAQFTRTLNEIRRLYPALVTGDVHILQDEEISGLFVFRRSHPQGDVLVALNNSNSNKSYAVNMGWKDVISGTTFTGVVSPDTTLVMVPQAFYHPIHAGEQSRYHAGRSKPPSQQPLAVFSADGLLDSAVTAVASNDSTVLYAAYNTEAEMLYLAVTPASKNHDRFIMVSYTPSSEQKSAPWEKKGVVPAYDILISDEGDSDYTSIRGATNIHWSACRSDGIFEAGLKISRQLTSLYIRTTEYETEDRGNLNAASELPAAHADQPYIEINLSELGQIQP